MLIVYYVNIIYNKNEHKLFSECYNDLFYVYMKYSYRSMYTLC